MPKTTYEAWVTSFVTRLSEHLNLSGWSIQVKFVDAEDKLGTYAENTINTQYMFSTLTFYKQSKLDFESGKIDQLVMAVVHEMIHIFLDPFQDYMHPHLSLTTTPLFMNTLEQQTQKLTMVFLKTLPKNIIPKR
jgi:hypothetical protein